MSKTMTIEELRAKLNRTGEDIIRRFERLTKMQASIDELHAEQRAEIADLHRLESAIETAEAEVSDELLSAIPGLSKRQGQLPRPQKGILQ